VTTLDTRKRRVLDTAQALGELVKPGITLMVMATAAVGYAVGSAWCAAPVQVPQLLWAAAGTGLVAGGAAALNMVIERRIDARMLRTQHRPLPSGRVRPGVAIVWALCLSIAGLAVLASLYGPWAAGLALLTWVAYLFVYTPLKTLTPLATFAGAAPGAAPPLIGWAAACGRVSPEAFVLFAILFVWQIPHFNAIAWAYREDYARGGLRVLSVVDPTGRRSTRQAWGHSLALLFLGVAPAFLGLTGWYASIVAALLGAALLVMAWRFRACPSETTAKALFFASLPYLAIVFTAIALDR
jgi:protoheme IX farnesyltransferase